MFLSHMLTQDLQANPPSSTGIDGIIDRGRDEFERLIARRRKIQEEVYQQTRQKEGEKQAEQFLQEFGGDSIGVAEIGNYADPYRLRLQPFYQERESFILTPDPIDLDTGRSTTIQFFEHRLREGEAFFASVSSDRRSLGIILHYNGYSYAVAMVRQGQGIEYAIFDSHGNRRLNGTSEAFIFTTNTLNHAAQFLGNLVLYVEPQQVANRPGDIRSRIAIYHFVPDNAS
jgi:hypothetical protein